MSPFQSLLHPGQTTDSMTVLGAVLALVAVVAAFQLVRKARRRVKRAALTYGVVAAGTSTGLFNAFGIPESTVHAVASAFGGF